MIVAWLVPLACSADVRAQSAGVAAPSLSATLVPALGDARGSQLAVSWSGRAGVRLSARVQHAGATEAPLFADQVLNAGMNLLSLALDAGANGSLQLVVRDAEGATVAHWSHDLKSLRGASGFAWESAFFGPGVDKPVNAMVVWDDGSGPALYVGGEFATAGAEQVNGIARWNGQVWSALAGPSGTGVGSPGTPSVYSLAVYDGALIVGGAFSTAGGLTANNIARWNGSAWSTFDGPSTSGADGLVYTLGVYDGALIAGGSFTEIADSGASHIARWNGSSWSALGQGINSSVYAMTLYNGALVVGGSFATAGGLSASNIARWDGSTWSALPGATGAGVNGIVRALTVFDGALIAGGGFTQAGGQSAGRIARWDGATWSALGSGTGGAQNPNVSALTVFDGALIAGGTFPMMDGAQVNYIARWNGSAWSELTTPVGAGMSGGVFALTLYDGALVAGGTFSQAGGEPSPIGGGINTNGIARWNGSAWSALEGDGAGAGMSSQVSALAIYNGALIVGGSFTRAGNVDAWGIARWDGHAWSPLSGASGSGVQTLPFDSVNALTLYHGDLIVGGQFRFAGGVTANNIARWDGHEWSPLRGASGIGTSTGAVFELAVYNGALFAAGGFEQAGGRTVNNVARWDGTDWSALSGPAGVGTDQTVTAMTVYDGGLIVGAGGTAGGVDVNHIARWDGNAWSALGSGMDSEVRALNVYDGALIAGGFFDTAGGVTVNHIARWNGSNWSGLGEGTSGFGGMVYALGVYDGALIAGGVFSEAGGVRVNGIARWDGNVWSTLSGPIDAGMGGSDAPIVFALLPYAVDGVEKLVAGGNFLTTGGVSNWRLGMYGPVAPGGHLGLTPSTIDFGVAFPPGPVVGPLATTLTNNGNVPMQISAMSDASNPFHRAGGDCPQAPFTLAAGASCVISYVFVPITTGDFEQTLAIANDDGPALELTLVGVGVPPPTALTITPDSVNFGMIPVGISVGPAPFTLSNSALVPVSVSAISAANAPFVVADGDCPTAPFDLAPMASCTLRYRFSPTQLGPVSQTFEVTSNAGTKRFTIEGTGLPGIPSVLALISGDGQVAPLGTAFTSPLVVQVRDAWNNPVPGISVSFTAPDSGPGALLSATSVVTDANGNASVEATANTEAGSYTVVVHGGLGDPVAFALTNLALVADIDVGIRVDHEYVQSGQRLSYRVTVHNAGPSAVDGATVASVLSPLLDRDTASWSCIGPPESGCTPAGRGELLDNGLHLAVGASVSYLLSASVRADAGDGRVETGVSVRSSADANPANDSATAVSQIVIFRAAFEASSDGPRAGIAERGAD